MAAKKAKSPPRSKPLETAPPVPASLKKKKHAAAYWKRITAELVKVQAITTLHLEPLETICRQWQIYIECSDWCDNNPKELIVEYKSGYLIEHPRVRMRQQAFANLSKMWPKFGLTPEGLVKIGRGSPGAAIKPRPNAVRQFAERKGSK